MNPDDIAARHEGLASAWLLHGAGFTVETVKWWSRDLRALFPGVYLTGSGPVTKRQRWRAATLTAPDTWLAYASAAAAHGIAEDPVASVIVVRAGQGGPQWFGELCLTRSTVLAGNVTDLDGLLLTTVERTIIDLWPTRRGFFQEKLVREALRQQLTTPEHLIRVICLHKGRRGTRSLRAFVQRFSTLPFARCKSDAEVLGLCILHEAGVPAPEVNEVFAGGEADFCWPELMLIIELDGPQYHRLTDRDAAKQARWEAAGFTVLRLPTPLLYADPATLLALAPRP